MSSVYFEPDPFDNHFNEMYLNTLSSPFYNAPQEDIGIIIFDRHDRLIYQNAHAISLFDLPGDSMLPVQNGLGICESFQELMHIIKSQHPVDTIHKLVYPIHDAASSNYLTLKVDIIPFQPDSLFILTAVKTQDPYAHVAEQEELETLAHITRLGLLGEMASGIAHELNQPLSAITAYTESSLTLLNQSEIDRPKLNETLLKTNLQAHRAGKIIHRMRHLIKTQQNKYRPTDINALILDAVALLEFPLTLYQIGLHTQLSTALPQILIDDVQIEQVIINLLKNSIDSLNDNPNSTDKTISIQSYINDSHQIEVRIDDNGPGIPPDLQQKLMKPFFTTKKEGTGIGLCLSRAILESHEGQLRFDSTLDAGSTFYFTLPIHTQ